MAALSVSASGSRPAGRTVPRAVTLPAPAAPHRPATARVAAALAALLLAGAALETRGDEIRMEPIDGPRMRVEAPPRGMTMERVRDALGEPAQRAAPVGDPPISRWEYDDFVVYFEYRYVLHSVVKRAP